MDFQLVKSCLKRGNYNLLKPQIPYEVLGQGTVGMLRWIGAFYTSNPEAGSITTEQLKAYISMRMQKQLDTDGVKVLMKLCDQVAAAPEEYTPTLLNSLLELDFAGKVGALYTRYESGGEVAFLDEVTTLAKEYQMVRGVPEIPEHDILEILKEMENQEGVVLGRLALLREYLTPIQGGASIALAARPDKGKSSLLCALLTGSAESAMGYYGASRPILHLVNEGNERRVIPRLYQAAMGITSEEMYAKAHAGTLVDDYANAIQAEPDYIKVIPIHGRDMAYIEQLVEEYNPSIVVTDMLEHVGYNAASKTEKITGLWEKIRDTAIIHDFISIATVQIGESGGNTLFPTYDTINYSKTGIQAATDIILMMGSLDSAEHQEIRGLSTPKNKFSVQGKPSYVETEVIFDKDRCIFDDGTDLSAMRTVPTSRKQITTEEILNAKHD